MKTALLLSIVLAGCSSIPQGIKINEEEIKACKSEGCTVWTDAELTRMARKFWSEGYSAGLKSL
jgi:starvation-inducible outer membrane lipoprotein